MNIISYLVEKLWKPSFLILRKHYCRNEENRFFSFDFSIETLFEVIIKEGNDCSKLSSIFRPGVAFHSATGIAVLVL